MSMAALAVTWLCAASLTCLVLPWLLVTGSWRVWHPWAAMLAWQAAVVFGAGIFLIEVMGTVAAASAGVGGRQFDGYGSLVFGFAAWGGLAAVGVAVSVVFTRLEPLVSGRRFATVGVTLLAARNSYRVERMGRAEIVYVRAARPFSCSLPGGRIIVSSALEELLSPGEVRAVVEHERAHLRRGHSRFVAASRIVAGCCPLPGLRRRLEHSSNLLVELIADDAAARACGPATVCNALAALARATGEPGLSLRASRLAARPIRRHSAAARGALASPVVVSDGLAGGSTGLE